jgi:hypothetical protein
VRGSASLCGHFLQAAEFETSKLCATLLEKQQVVASPIQIDYVQVPR